MRAVGPAVAVALSGVILWKLFATLFLPFLGVVLGLLASTAKIALVIAVIFFIYTLIRKRREQAGA
jgi:4-hydroxybenzoate polyprenyltransferase